MAQGIEAVALVVQQWPEVDAIVCVSDPPAFGALMECQRRGWAVPGRIAIAGFGDFEVGKGCHPRLTTVAVDNEHIGRRAGELLLRAVAAAAVSGWRPRRCRSRTASSSAKARELPGVDGW